jgi:GTP cyclohydrolase II
MQKKTSWQWDLADQRRMRSLQYGMAARAAGLPIILAGKRPILASPAESATQLHLNEMLELGISEATLLLAAGRAAGLGHSSTFPPDTMLGFRIRLDDISPEELRGLADPTLPQLLKKLGEPVAVPMTSEIAVRLAKRRGLLPALVVAPLGATAIEQAMQSGIARVDAEPLAEQLNHVPAVERIAEATLPLRDAIESKVVMFRGLEDGTENLALIIGSPENGQAPLVRVHSSCFTGDILGSLRCDCGPQLHRAVERIAEEEAGVVIYLSQEGRGIGLSNKLRAYSLQDQGADTLEANHQIGWESDARSFGLAAAILKDLGLTRIRLLSNNPDKCASISSFGILVQSRVRHTIAPNGTNDRYLETKRTCCGHLMG